MWGKVMIKGLTEARNTLGQFDFAEFDIVREFHLWEAEDTLCLGIILFSEMRPWPNTLKILLRGVHDLRVREFGGSLTQLGALELRHFRTEGGEALVRAEDYEEDLFYCVAAEANVEVVLSGRE